MRLRRLWLSLWLLPLPILAQSANAPRQTPPQRRFEIHRAASPIRVDGALDEPAWASALVFDLPYEWLPGDNVPPPVKTDFLVTYDDRYLYAAWRAYDPHPEEIRAHLMDRDSIDTFIQDDHVLLTLDTFNDERRGFQFRINPLGVQVDALFTEAALVPDWAYDMIWQSAARITDEGYVVEIAIPLNQIRFPRTGGPQTWGFEVGRSYPRSTRHRITAGYFDRNLLCILCQVTKVTGFENLTPGRNLEMTPTVTASRFDAPSFTAASGRPGPLAAGDEEVDAGLSARWGVTPNVSLNAALNPDFSQVEADAAQLTVNERFALFFPEKRPFFLEGSDFFATPLQTVFTRTVVHPKWGAKLTGKEGANAFGFFATEDDENRLTIPTNQQSFFRVQDEPVTTGVVRYRRDIGKASNLGVLYVDREGDDYHHRVGGLDGFARFSSADTVKFQFLRASTSYPAVILQDPNLQRFAGGLHGDALLVDYGHFTRSWLWTLTYDDREPEFRADSGFLPRVDIRDWQGSLQRQFWGNGKKWYDQLVTGLRWRRTENHTGQLTDERINYSLGFSGPLQLQLDFATERNKSFFQGTLYSGLDAYSLAFRIQPSGVARLLLLANYGETVDFTNNQPADALQLQPIAELKLGRHVNAKIDHTLQRLKVEGGTLFTANLSQVRVVYNFNVRCFVRGIFQYLDVQRNPDLYLESLRPSVRRQTETFFTQLLFSYKLNPQTVLFLGYADNRLGTEQFSLDPTDRTFFFKVGYAWSR